MSRLTPPDRVQLLTRVLRAVWHGGESVTAPAIEVVSLIPLFFGLLPRAALTRDSILTPVKGDIRLHLAGLGVPCDELLVDVLKRVADQYVQTRPPRQVFSQKVSLGTLRDSRPHAIHNLIARQVGRCCVCGTALTNDTHVAIDHVLPWRIGGDKDANLQLLCERCNRGKRDYVSPLQSPRIHGWMYGLDGLDLSRVNEDSRYVALAVAGRCMFLTCLQAPRDGELDVYSRSASAIATLDNCVVSCGGHVEFVGSPLHWCEWHDAIERSVVTFGAAS
jgi:5-methylcytosine-specific restriction endonuclease McrA